MAVTSVWWSMTRKPPVRPSWPPASPYSTDPSSISAIPGGNRVEIVGYDNIQFTKAPNVLRGMGLTHLAKNENAKKELAQKGMAVE